MQFHVSGTAVPKPHWFVLCWGLFSSTYSIMLLTVCTAIHILWTMIHLASLRERLKSCLQFTTLVFNGCLANRGLISLVKEATGDARRQDISSHCTDLIHIFQSHHQNGWPNRVWSGLFWANYRSSISWLLIPQLLALPGHQWPRFSLCNIADIYLLRGRISTTGAISIWRNYIKCK